MKFHKNNCKLIGRDGDAIIVRNIDDCDYGVHTQGTAVNYDTFESVLKDHPDCLLYEELMYGEEREIALKFMLKSAESKTSVKFTPEPTYDLLGYGKEYNLFRQNGGDVPLYFVAEIAKKKETFCQCPKYPNITDAHNMLCFAEHKVVYYQLRLTDEEFKGIKEN